MQYFTSLIVGLLATNTSAQTSPPPEAKATQSEFREAVAKAKADYDAAIKKATAAHREKLTAIQSERTKAGDLDGALAIRKLLLELDEGVAGPNRPKEVLAREKFSAALSKVVWSPGQGGWGKPFAFAADGFVESPPGKQSTATWAAINPGTVVVVQQSGVVDVFNIDLAKGTAKVSSIGSAQKPVASWDASKMK